MRVEAAWTAIDHSPYGKEQFGRIRVRLGDKKAIVAIARRLLVTLWHILTKGEADRHADVPLVKRKMLRWGNKLRAAGRQGLGRAAFVATEVARLGFAEHDASSDAAVTGTTQTVPRRETPPGKSRQFSVSARCPPRVSRQKTRAVPGVR